MSKHQLTYIDFYPAPVDREPSTLAIWAGAALFMLALCLLTVFLFTL
jgi:hypothetical protein